jgi:glycosyltransferase involved in cell wall biosynthesis
MIFVPPAGGVHPRDKLRLFGVAPLYIPAIWRALKDADVIQVRTPGSLGLYGLVMLSLATARPHWVKYAGNWMEDGQSPPSFTFQRWWLRNGFSRGPVTINGRWPDQPPFIHPFYNPSMSLDEALAIRPRLIDKALTSPLSLVFVGRLEKAKGALTALRVFYALQQRTETHLEIVGDGPQRTKLEQMSQALGASQRVSFHGWQPHEQVIKTLEAAHFILLPSETEGWPKVLSEAMACGAVPLASNVSAIPQILHETQAGFALPVNDSEAYVEVISAIMQAPERWKALSQAGLRAAPLFTYEKYLVDLDEMFISAYNRSPMIPEVIQAVRRRLNEAQGF